MRGAEQGNAGARSMRGVRVVLYTWDRDAEACMRQNFHLAGSASGLVPFLFPCRFTAQYLYT